MTESYIVTESEFDVTVAYLLEGEREWRELSLKALAAPDYFEYYEAKTLVEVA
jgi:hypothetical protein